MSQNNERPVAVVTGASSGIGKAAARALLARGWRVIGVGRDPDRCAQAARELGDSPDGAFTMLRADLSRLPEAAQVAAQIGARAPELDVLVNNAGGVQAERAITPEGHEATFAANHLGPFLLTQRLLPNLKAAVASRVITVSSSGHEHCPAMRWDDLTYADGYVAGAAYCHAKLANVLFARELARRTAADGVVSHAMHPGVVDSNFADHCDPPMKAYMLSIKDRALTPEQAADTLVWLATDEQPGRSTGLYWHDRQALPPSPAAQDDEAAKRLWELSEAAVSGY